METKFNFNSQVCTSREQSEKLLALGLKKETADMCSVIDHVSDGGKWEEVDTIFSFTPDDWNFRESVTPRWSLHRLLEMNLNSTDTRFEVRFNQLDVKDAYEILLAHIEWLIKEGYFNKEYLV